jgi:uncharacterized protein (DUF1800 family)
VHRTAFFFARLSGGSTLFRWQALLCVMDQPSTLAAASLAAAALAACGGTETPPPPAAMLALADARRDAGLLASSALRAPQRAMGVTWDASALMDWAQQAYAQYFPSAQADAFYAPYTYRYYPETQTYLGVAGGDVYVLGPVTGGALTWVGTLEGFRCVAQPASCSPSAPASAAEAARFLAQATPGATKAEITALQGTTYAQWLEAQFALPRGQSCYDWLMAHGYSDEAYRSNSQGFDAAIWHKLIAAADPLRQRVALALSEILVVSIFGVNTQWRQFAVGHYYDVLEGQAFGNYRALLDEVTLTTAMGIYLTYRNNAKANPTSGSEPDENYARELMQLFTIGLLNLDANGVPSGGETYTAADVSGLARVFTGWERDDNDYPMNPPPEVQRRPMVQNAKRYETGEKTFLGVTIPAGTSARDSLTIALDTLFHHPNAAPFVCRQLIQRLVTSNPSPAYVGRVAAAFANNGAGVRGDLKAVIRAILLDFEARDAATAAAPAFGKLREPLVRFLQWARAFNATSPSDAWAIGDLSDPGTRLGQSPLRSSSVFNFFRPGYVPPTSAIASAGLAAPEFQITTESSVAGYVNFMQRAVNGQGVGDLAADNASLLALAGDSAALLDELNLVLAAQQIPASRLASLKTALDTIAVTTDAGKLNRVKAALVLVLAAPEYVVQK